MKTKNKHGLQECVFQPYKFSYIYVVAVSVW